jgi:hypothetical protein
LFPSHEEALDFTETYDLDVARAGLYEAVGRLSDAAELHLEEGRTLQGVRLFLKDTSSQNSMLRAKECVLHGLWQKLSFGVHIKVNGVAQDVQELLTLADQLQLRSSDRDEVRTPLVSRVFPC